MSLSVREGEAECKQDCAQTQTAQHTQSKEKDMGGDADRVEEKKEGRD